MEEIPLLFHGGRGTKGWTWMEGRGEGAQGRRNQMLVEVETNGAESKCPE